MISRKFFPADKNTILKEAQQSCEQELICGLLDLLKDLYHKQFNPLGIEDSFVKKLNNSHVQDFEFFRKPYHILAALYRFQHGNNQLELIWDGRTHVEYYQDLWKIKYVEWIATICIHKPALTRILLKSVIFRDQKINNTFLEKYITNSFLDYFGFKLLKKEGKLIRRGA